MSKRLKEDILALFHKGLTYKEIRQTLNCSQGIVCYYCTSLQPDPYTKNQIANYQLFYNSCGSISSTATHFNIGRKKLSLHIDKTQYVKAKIPKRKRLNLYNRKIKVLAIEYKGGKCIKCGYNKCLRALDFHHTNPEIKEFQISGGTRSFETIKPELDKCDLLCRNCHAEEHDRLDKLKNIEA